MSIGTLQDTMRIPIHKKQTEKLSKLVASSTGVEFVYIQYAGETLRVRPDQLWFWDDEWQSGEKEVDQYIKNHNYEEFDSLEDMFQSVHDR